MIEVAFLLIEIALFELFLPPFKRSEFEILLEAPAEGGGA
jgi:hypothetical protein